MAHLSGTEQTAGLEALYVALYGADNYTRWRQLKVDMNFDSEESFITWILNFIESVKDVNTREYYGADGGAAGVEWEADSSGDPVTNDNNYYEHGSLAKHRRLCGVQHTAAASDLTQRDRAATVKHEGSCYDRDHETVECASKGPSENDTLRVGGDYAGYPHCGGSNGRAGYDGTVTVDERCRCEQCGKPFSGRSNLRAHVRTVHLGLRYQCMACEQQFTSRQNLKFHLLRKHNVQAQHATILNEGDLACE